MGQAGQGALGEYGPLLAWVAICQINPQPPNSLTLERASGANASKLITMIFFMLQPNGGGQRSLHTHVGQLLGDFMPLRPALSADSNGGIDGLTLGMG